MNCPNTQPRPVIFKVYYFHSNICSDVKVEDVRSDRRDSVECKEKDVCQAKENDQRFDGTLRQNNPAVGETPQSANSNTDATCGQTSPNSSVSDDAVTDPKPTTEETALVSNSTDGNLSKVASMSMEKAHLDLSLSQNTSADVEMLSPESPTCKSLLCNSPGESHNPCTEAQAPCGQSSSPVESTNILDPRAEPEPVGDPDVTAMETDNSDMPETGGDSVTANKDSTGNQSQTRYTHICDIVFSSLQKIRSVDLTSGLHFLFQ